MLRVEENCGLTSVIVGVVCSLPSYWSSTGSSGCLPLSEGEGQVVCVLDIHVIDVCVVRMCSVMCARLVSWSYYRTID